MREFLQKLKSTLLTFFFLISLQAVNGQTSNYVFSGGEAANFGTIDLSTPATQTWATDRSAAPGYFSATMDATYASASDADNINGYVKKYGNEAFTFPVGNGTDLRTLSISAPSAATDAYATAWIAGNPSGALDPTTPNSGTHSITSVTFPIVTVSNSGWVYLNRKATKCTHSYYL